MSETKASFFRGTTLLGIKIPPLRHRNRIYTQINAFSL